MSVRKFSTIRRKVAYCCWPLLALTVAAAPSSTWAQDCNAESTVTKLPSKVYSLGETVQITYSFGAGPLGSGISLTVNNAEAYIGLDCATALTGTQRENCLGFNGAAAADAANDGDAITYAGNLTSGNVGAGNACTGLNFTATTHGDGNPPEVDPNIVVLQADGPIVFDTGERCFVTFDAVVNSIGLPANWDVGNQIVNTAGGFSGSCTATLGASSTQSTAYEIDITPAIVLKKEVSVDGGAWFDANVAPFPTGYVPGSTAEYRLIVQNVGEEPLENVLINDNSAPLFLGLVAVPLPDRCYVNGVFPVGASCTIVSGDSGFGGLGTPPVQVCLTAGTKTNIACVDADGAASGEAAAQSCDPANVVCLEPGITVTKDGPPKAKVGDEVTYTICATNTGGVDLENCTLDDTLLGNQGLFRADAMPLVPAEQACDTYTRTVLATDPDQLENIATVTCDVVGTASNVSDNDNHIVDLFQPSIVATKTGPTEAKVGDEVCYDIGFTNTSSPDTPALVNCTGSDTLLDISSAVFVSGQTQQFCRTTLATDPNPLPNTATITCELDGYDNGLPAPASASHAVDLYTVGAVLSKDCAPDTTIMVPDPISWEICVENTGTLDISCDVSDPTAGIASTIGVPAGFKDCSLTASRATTSADVPTVTNTATAVCTAVGWDNAVPTDPATDTCTVDEPGDELCRTPGFWKTHAGTEKANRSNNLTQAVIDYAPGGTLGSICGVEINNTSVAGYSDPPAIMEGDGNGSAMEGMCVHPKQKIVRQLMRQLIAASLNCVASGGQADCTGISVEDDWEDANLACVAEAADMSDWIERIDAFNNGMYPYTCTENIQDSRVFDNWQGPKVPGPAGSSNACNEATYNDFYLVPLP